MKKDSGSDDSGGYGGKFSRNTFLSLEDMCISCDSGMCDNMEQGFECVEGYNANANVEDDMKVCKTYKKVTKEWTYASPKRNYHIALLVFALFLVVLFCAGAYTYFVRHKRAAAEKELHETSAMADETPTKAEYAELT